MFQTYRLQKHSLPSYFSLLDYFRVDQDSAIPHTNLMGLAVDVITLYDALGATAAVMLQWMDANS